MIFHLFRDHLEPSYESVSSQRLEPELSATRGQGFDDATDVVADQTELGGAALLLHRATQRGLSIASHGISLVLRSSKNKCCKILYKVQ